MGNTSWQLKFETPHIHFNHILWLSRSLTLCVVILALDFFITPWDSTVQEVKLKPCRPTKCRVELSLETCVIFWFLSKLNGMCICKQCIYKQLRDLYDLWPAEMCLNTDGYTMLSGKHESKMRPLMFYFDHCFHSVLSCFFFITQTQVQGFCCFFKMHMTKSLYFVWNVKKKISAKNVFQKITICQANQ